VLKTELTHYFLLTEKGKDDVIPDGIRQGGAHIPASSDKAIALFAAHRGTSMNPTLSEDDILEVRPYRDGSVSKGDVIYFTAPEDGSHVVHRVISTSGERISTKGDNCRYEDPWLLAEADIKGRVTAAWRGRERRKVAGGMPGLVTVHVLHLWRSAVRLYSIPLRPLYRLVVKSRLLHNLVPKKLRPHVLAFESNGRRYKKLIAGGHVIGSCDHVTQGWKIGPFFRPFIYEEDLVKTRKKELPG